MSFKKDLFNDNIFNSFILLIFSVQIEDKHIVYYVVIKGAEYIMTAQNIQVTDGHWHNVTLVISGKSVYFMMDQLF